MIWPIITLIIIVVKIEANHHHHFEYEDIYPHELYEPIFYDVRYDLPEDIIRNKRDSRYFPGHVPAGVKGITKVTFFILKTIKRYETFTLSEIIEIHTEHS